MSKEKPTQIKSSRAIPIDSQAHTEAFGRMVLGTIHTVPEYVRDSVLPPDYPGRTTVQVAGSGLGAGGFAVEQIISATTASGDPLHKTYRYEYTAILGGGSVRQDVTYDYSTSTNGQVNDHHQHPEETKQRLGNWPGFESL
ncbi:hypothetical protein [Singulisphaera acidiphila]|uniref:hypothetical protein n=1 Tax=Singulisphaera acidiphila TaxID=466153 RepID=UPI0012F8EB22|nr:hypothetical protein [Singulisphaera acidiphila]